MIALNIAISGSALIGFPWWKARVRAVLFWWPRVMIPTGCLAEVGKTGYTLAMAKVMISLPDGLLARLDASARERGSTRSAAIRELAEAAFDERERQLAKRMADLDGRARGHGGDVVSKLKAGRPA